MGHYALRQGVLHICPESRATQPHDKIAADRQPGSACESWHPDLHDCGSLDPWPNDQTCVVEKKYKELGGQITVIIREGECHFPLAPKDPKPVVDFIFEPLAIIFQTF